MIRMPVAVAAMALSLLIGGYVSPSDAKVLYVDDDGLGFFQCEGAPYRSIGAALAAAGDGDEIRICPGVYPEQVVLEQRIRLTGFQATSQEPIVIKPTALPAVRPSLLGANPVTGAIIVDAQSVLLSNLEVDLSDVSLSTCLPFLTGIYVRGASGAIDTTAVRNVRVSGAPTCSSGVGVYIESGATGEILGNPVIVPARVIVRDLSVSGFQKAGLVGNGPRAVIKIRGGEAIGDGPSVGAVQYGYQFGYGAKVKVADVAARGHRSLITGKAASGVLVYRAGRVGIRKSTIRDSQEGVIGIGDRLRVKGTEFGNMAGDGVVFIGNANLSVANFVENAAVSGVFVKGNRNRVRGGVMRAMPVGVWFQSGEGSKYGGVRFEGVPVAFQGVYGGVRWDLGVDSAQPFSTECASAADCDDGNSCTTATCADGHCSYEALPDGSVCDDGNSCTTGACDAGTCVGTAVAAGTPCVDASPCTAGETCDAGGNCIGIQAGAGTSCDDGNPCTAGDVCSADGTCGGSPVAQGTGCDDGNGCTLNDACDVFGVCRGEAAPLNTVCDDGNECTVDRCDTAVCRSEPVADFTACGGGTLACLNGVCS